MVCVQYIEHLAFARTILLCRDRRTLRMRREYRLRYAPSCVSIAEQCDRLESGRSGRQCEGLQTHGGRFRCCGGHEEAAGNRNSGGAPTIAIVPKGGQDTGRGARQPARRGVQRRTRAKFDVTKRESYRDARENAVNGIGCRDRRHEPVSMWRPMRKFTMPKRLS